MLFNRFVAVVSIGFCVALVPGIAEAQGRGQQRMQPLRVSGKVHAVGPRGLQMVADDGTPWVVQPPENMEAMIYDGTASVQWLQRGMFVRFSANLNQQLVAQQPVSAITVITVRPGIEPGVFPEGAAVAGSDEEDEAGKEAKKGRKSRKSGQDMIVPCLVIGRVYGLKDGELSVAAVGRNVVKAKLAEDTAVNVQMNDFRMARQGDKIELTGLFSPDQPGRAVARSLTISAANPLGAVPQAGGRRNAKNEKEADPPEKEKKQRREKKDD